MRKWAADGLFDISWPDGRLEADLDTWMPSILTAVRQTSPVRGHDLRFFMRVRQ